MNEIESIQAITNDKTLISGDIIVEYEGEINSQISDSLIDKIDKVIDRVDLSLKVKKKLFNISIESIQNLSHYSKLLALADRKYHNVVLKISNSPNYVSILSGNFIKNSHVISVRNRLSLVSEMSIDELGKLYRGVLELNNTSETGGAGLGFIDIARKSNKQLDFHIIEIDIEYCFFILIVNILK